MISTRRLLGQQRCWRVLLTGAVSSIIFWYHFIQNQNQNNLPITQKVDNVNSHSHLNKEREKFLVNCSTALINYTSPVNLVHVLSSVTGGSDFDMSVHDPEKEVISMEIKKHGCFECNILRPLISALKNSKNASLIDIGYRRQYWYVQSPCCLSW